MAFYDVTLTIRQEMPSWPGDPPIKLERFRKIEEGANANATRIEITAHNGTHVDAPIHFIPGEKGVDQLDLEVMVGPALVLEVPAGVNTITASILEGARIPPGTLRLLLKTRNSRYWADHVNDFQADFVGVEADAAEYLVSLGIKLLGIDYLSVAPYKRSRPTHEALLKAHMVLLEGLDLSRIAAGQYMLYCLPLKIEGSDGAPARVILSD
jgi:arylformamidase